MTPTSDKKRDEVFSKYAKVIMVGASVMVLSLFVICVCVNCKRKQPQNVAVKV